MDDGDVTGPDGAVGTVTDFSCQIDMEFLDEEQYGTWYCEIEAQNQKTQVKSALFIIE